MNLSRQIDDYNQRLSGQIPSVSQEDPSKKPTSPTSGKPAPAPTLTPKEQEVRKTLEELKKIQYDLDILKQQMNSLSSEQNRYINPTPSLTAIPSPSPSPNTKLTPGPINRVSPTPTPSPTPSPTRTNPNDSQNITSFSPTQSLTPSPTAQAIFSSIQLPTTSVSAKSATFEITATGAVNTDGIWFGVWSQTNGQDDLVWYNGTNKGGGNFVASVDLSKHGLGITFVRACAVNAAHPTIDTSSFCLDATFMILPE